MHRPRTGGPGVDGSSSDAASRESSRQREYLERSVDSLKRKLAKDSELHRTDNLRVMQVSIHAALWPECGCWVCRNGLHVLGRCTASRALRMQPHEKHSTHVQFQAGHAII